MAMQVAPANRTVLRDLIDARGLKYIFVADKIGTTPYGLTRLMNRDRTLTASELVSLADLLRVDSSAFFDGNELILSSCTSTNDLPLAGAQDTPGRGQSVNGREEDVA